MVELVNEAAQRLIRQEKLDPNIDLGSYRIAAIFQSFLSLEVIHKCKPAMLVFQNMKKRLSAQKHKMWYKELVTIEPPHLELEMVKPFPKVEVIDHTFQEALNQAKIWNKNMFCKLSEKEKMLVEDKLKAHVMGIPSPSTKLDAFMEFSRGESILVDWNDIAEIQIVKDKSNNERVHNSFMDFPKRNNFNSLTTWFTYKIEKDMLVFSGTPSRADIGKLIIRIFNADDVVIREFGVEITDKFERKKRGGFMEKTIMLKLGTIFGSSSSKKTQMFASKNSTDEHAIFNVAMNTKDTLKEEQNDLCDAQMKDIDEKA